MYLDEREVHAYIGSAPDIDRNDPRQLASVQYDSGEFFQDQLRQAAIKADRRKRAVELKMPHGTIVVLPDTHCVMVDIEESGLRAFCAVPVIDGTLAVSVLKKAPTAEDIERTTPMSMEPLLWNTAFRFMQKGHWCAWRHITNKRRRRSSRSYFWRLNRN